MEGDGMDETDEGEGIEVVGEGTALAGEGVEYGLRGEKGWSGRSGGSSSSWIGVVGGKLMNSDQFHSDPSCSSPPSVEGKTLRVSR
jgi:hypothetical protein